MLGGTTQPDGSYVSGFFDKGTFKEYLGAPCLPLAQSSPSYRFSTAFYYYSHSLIAA